MATINVGAIAPPPPPLADDPTIAGFTVWIYAVMGVPEAALPPSSVYIQLAFDESVNIAYIGLKLVKNRSRPRQYVIPPPLSPTAPIVDPPHPAHPIAPTPTVTRPLQSPSVYAIAVYNLGGHILCEIANDDPDLPPPLNTFWADLRQRLGLNSFSYGLITSAADQGTSAGQMIPKQIQDLSLLNLDMLKTPWGRRYLQIAGQWGTLWGIS